MRDWRKHQKHDPHYRTGIPVSKRAGIYEYYKTGSPRSRTGLITKRGPTYTPWQTRGNPIFLHGDQTRIATGRRRRTDISLFNWYQCGRHMNRYGLIQHPLEGSWAEGQTENTCALVPSEGAHLEFGRAVHHDDPDCWQG